MVDARRARESIADFQTARIVAMIEAVNSKRHKYDPVRWMMNGAELKRQARAAAERRALTGDEIIARMRRLGVPVIDKRTGANSGINQR